MKFKVIVIGFLLIGFKAVKCQTFLSDATVFKRGIYKNIEEFKQNSPSLELKYPIKEKTRNIGGLLSTDSHTSYLLEIKQKELDTIGIMFAFCDGKNVFISNKASISLENGNSTFKPEFYKMEHLGRFIHFVEYGYNTTIGYGNMAQGSIRVDYDSFIDLKTEKFIEKRKKVVSEILKDDEALSLAFANEERPNKKIVEYLLMYNKKHPFLVE